MFAKVEISVWLLTLIIVFAAVTFASHFLFPSVRWFFRKLAERAIARLNKRLARPIEPFKLARRYDTIERLIYDPDVAQAIAAYSASERVPESVAFEKARHYAREIVPSFSATAYFGFGTRLAAWLSRTMYNIRLGDFDREALSTMDPDAAVVFVMNHRSNMDYVLVTHLTSGASALSYAVGEWARVWPLSAMIRAMGAYFIRRRSQGTLYRRVLARYVQSAVEAGVTQALFPEGGLSLDGRLSEPKLGLLSYIVSNWSPNGREVIFVPVALNYDRVLEDRFLIAADKSGVRRFRAPMGQVIRVTLGHLWQRITLRLRPFGTASVGFGRPLELSRFLLSTSGDPTAAVAAELMRRIGEAMPVLPVPLVARGLLGGLTSAEALRDRIGAELEDLGARGVKLPRRDAPTLTADALANLRERRLISGPDTQIEIGPEARDILAFYAASIEHLF